MAALAYAFYFLAATVAPIQRRWLARRNEGGDKIDLSFKVSFVRALFVLMLPLFSPFVLSGSFREIGILLLLSAIGGIGYHLSYFTAQRHVEAGVTSVLGNSYTPITIVLSSLLLGESLRGLQVLGAVLLIIASVIVSKKHRIGTAKYDRYFWLMVFSGFSLSILLVADRQLMKITGFTASTVLSWWAVSLGLFVLTLFSKGKTTYTSKDLVVTGGLKFFQDTSWAVLIYVVGNLSIVSAVTTFKIVLVFIIGALFLGEKEDLGRKIMGSLIAVLGLLLMK